MSKTLIICKDGGYGRGMAAQMSLQPTEAGTLGDVEMVRDLEEARKFIGEELGAVYVEQNDPLTAQQVSEIFSCPIKSYTLPMRGEIKDSRWGRLSFRVARAIERGHRYWIEYQFKIFLTFPLHCLIAVFLFLLNKLMPIRVVDFLSYRVGHQAYNTHIHFLKMQQEEKKPHVIALTPQPANTGLHKLQKRHWMCAIKSPKLRPLFENAVIRRRGFWESVHFYRDIDEPINKYDEDAVFLEFTAKEHKRGQEILASMGITPGRWFICLHQRDPAYLEKVAPSVDWKYHDYRDCSILNYIPAAEWVVSNGGLVVRMGAEVREKLVVRDQDVESPLPIESGIIDYPVQIRPKLGKDGAFADIYLAAHCSFFLGCSSGISQVASLFDVPRADANYPMQEYITNLSHRDIYIPKRILNKNTGKYLSLYEVLASGIGRFDRTEKFEQHALEIHENTAEEILLLCKEMLLKLTGNWKHEPGDGELLGRYFSMVNDKRFRSAGVKAEIATSFLRLHPEYVAERGEGE